ncbi:hypothetical protein BHM03_00025483 [Ensete ventricosum]|nr:hypothetical protein BHM03_00025483 [Ensete ventricosum]
MRCMLRCPGNDLTIQVFPGCVSLLTPWKRDFTFLSSPPWRSALDDGEFHESRSAQLMALPDRIPRGMPGGGDYPDLKLSGRLGSLARTVASSPEVGGSRVHSKSKELAVSSGELKQPTFRCPKSMKELCGTSVRKDDEGYYALHMIDLSPWDLDSEM